MGRIRGLVALAVAGATLVSGCVTANAADTSPADAGVTIQQDTTGSQTNGGSDDGTVTVTPPAGSDAGSTGGGADDAAGDTADKDGKDTGAPAGPSPTAKPGSSAPSAASTAGSAGGQARPKAAPAPQAKTKSKAERKATPDASGERRGTIHVGSQESSSLDGVTVRLYRVGRYPTSLDRAKALSWDDLHATAVDDTVRALAAKAVAGAGVKTSGDPVDVLWRSTDGVARAKAATELGDALLRAGVRPTASTVGDEQDASVPEGVYLGVPDTPDRQASVSATTVDGASRIDGGGFGWMTVMGRFDGASPELAEMPDDVRDGNGDSGLLGRLFGMFSVVPRTGEPFTLLGHRDYVMPGGAFTGIFDLRDDTTNKPVTALCVQAGADTPDAGTKFTRYDYSWNTAQEDRMRAVVYFSPYGPGTNVMRLPKGDKALGYMHYVFSAIHNNREDDIPDTIRNSNEYKALRDAAKNHPQPYGTGIRLMFYSIDPSIKNKQNLIFFDTAPRWSADVSTNAMYANSGTNGWRKVSQDRPARIFSNQITTGSRLRDEITVTARGNTHFRDDYFTIESHLNVDENRDGRPDKARTYLEIQNELILKNKSVSFLSPEATPGDLGYGKAWPAGANIWWDTIIRPARAGDPGYDGSNGNNGGKMWKSFLKSNVTYIGYSAGGTERPSEAYSTPNRPSITVSTFRRNANDGVAPASPTAPMHDSITVRHNGGNSIASAKAGNGKLIADVTLHADLNGDGREDLAIAAKRTVYGLPATFSATQSRTFDSEEFVPSDLKGQTEWQPNARYWFDAVVYGQDSVNWFTLGLQAVAVHPGSNDPNEQFQIHRNEHVDFSTKALAGTDANPTDPPALSGGTQRVRDRLYAQCTDIPAGTTFTGTLTLNWSKDGDATPEASKSKPVTMACGASWSSYYAPADLGMGAWQAGKYWFTLSVPKQTHVDQGKTLPGFDDSAESWTTVVPSVSFATRAQATFNIAGSTTPVSDLIWTGCTNIPSGTTFTGTSTLNVDTDRDGKADHTKSVTVAPKCGRTVASPTVSPKDLGVGDRWPAGFYWWDLNVPKQGRYVLNDTGHAGHGDAKESWTAAASRLMTAGVTSQAANGLVADWNQQDVTRDTKFDSHASSLLIAGGTDPVSDRVRLDVKSLDTPAHRDWDTNNDGRFDGNLRFTVKTTMHLTGGKSKAKTIAYASYHSVAGGNDSGTE
ncbi:Cell surface protein, partial [Bifidobacterium margollesii]